jgi:hypothetical protein
MHRPSFHHHAVARACLLVAAPLAAASMLVACGGGGGDRPSATTLSGVVATGDAVVGGVVTVQDSDPATPDPTPATTGSDGRYEIDVSTQRAPLLVTVTSAGAADATLASLVPTLSERAENAANVTPFTTAIALLANGSDEFASAADIARAGAPEAVSAATALVVQVLRSDPAVAALLPADFNPLTTPFVADGTGIDAALGAAAGGPAQMRAHERERQLSGKQFVVGQPRPRRSLWCSVTGRVRPVERAQRLGE